MYNLDEKIARRNTISLLSSSIPESLWNNNQDKVLDLKAELAEHHLFKHDIIQTLNQDSICLDTLKYIHLEYENSIVEIFTDALLMAQFQAKQLDKKIYSSVKMYPRFLLGLNIADEFGFSFETNNGLTPLNSHFCLFKKVLGQLNISSEIDSNHAYTEESTDLRIYLEEAYDDYIKLLLLLAVAEQQVIAFSAPLKQAVENAGINTKDGYYYVHGTTSDITTVASDDYHENDLWLLITHSLHLHSVEDLRTYALEYCQLWDNFWNKMLVSVKSTSVNIL